MTSSPHSIREQWDREVKPLIGRQGDGVGLGVAIVTTDFQHALERLIEQLQTAEQARDSADAAYRELVDQIASLNDAQEILRAVVDDYDRRRAGRWGRFLLWLLRKTT